MGDELADDGGVIGDVPVVSTTRDTWNRLRDGLGAGDDTGDGIGLGKGDLKRPPVVLRFGSNRCRSTFGMTGSKFRILWHVSEILREFNMFERTRLIAAVRTGSGSGGFSL